MAGYTHIIHPFPPVFHASSRVLILGSLPSVKSREEGFYYGHPRNRFWPLLSDILGESHPSSNEEKRQLLLKHGIALWDVILECDILSSSDSSIRSAVPTDLSCIFSAADIHAVFCNGARAGALYSRYQEPLTSLPATTLPSTSPANAAWSLEKLTSIWSEALLPHLNTTK